MSNESYHAETDSLSCSQLKVFCKSKRDYYEQFITGLMPKKQSTRGMVLGTICHAMLLERKSIDDVVRRYPESCLKSDGAINSKPARAFEEQIAPVIAVKDDVYEQAITICEAVLSTESVNGVPSLGDILRTGAQFEQRIDAEVDGVKCRCKPDIHAVLPDVVSIHDLKFVERIYPDDWWRTARMLKYWLQAAHYSRIAQAVYGKPATFRFWAVSVSYPYRVQMYQYESRSSEIANEYHADKLAEFRRCLESGNWHDSWDSNGVITPWDVGSNDDGELVQWEAE